MGCIFSDKALKMQMSMEEFLSPTSKSRSMPRGKIALIPPWILRLIGLGLSIVNDYAYHLVFIQMIDLYPDREPRLQCTKHQAHIDGVPRSIR